MPVDINGEYDWWHLRPASMNRQQFDEWCSAGKPVTGLARFAPRDDAARAAREEEIRSVCFPLIRTALDELDTKVMNEVRDLQGEINQNVTRQLEAIRRETRSLKRRARLRRWSRAEIDRYVNSLPKAPKT